MATTPSTGRRGTLRVVAAIVHHSGRLLLIERRGQSRLQAPAGIVTGFETPTDAFHRIVREQTGFAITERGVTGVFADAEGIVVTMRGEIRGIGSDFTGGTTGLRWCNALDLRTLVDQQPLAGSLLAALDAGRASDVPVHRLAS